MSSGHPKTATIVTPQSKTDPNDVLIEEIPLPPAEMWAELDNSVAAGSAKEESSTVAEPPTTDDANAASAEIEDLDFVGDGHERVITLKHSFRYRGQIVSQILVRRLRIGEVDHIIQKVRKGSLSTFDIYAEMTGFPAKVLRGLVDEDGDVVVDAAYDFLPRSLRADPVSSET